MAVKKTYNIEGMHCEKCVARVKKALEALPGVRAAKVSLEKNNAIVKMDEEIADEALVQAVEAEGFKASVPAGGFAR